MIVNKCKYTGRFGSLCKQNAIDNSIYCFWHDTKVDKTSDDIKEKLENLVDNGESLEGFQLRYANLEGVKLAGKKNTTNFSSANLYRCNLEGAHLYNVDFTNSSLMKANCNQANLNFSILNGANLLGINLHNAKIEHINWGRGVKQELDGAIKKKLGEVNLAKELYQEAEETYRVFFREYEERGLFDEAGKFFQKEMIMKRKQFNKFSKDWVVNVFSDLVTGYGEEPLKVFVFSILIVLLSSVLFAFFGMNISGEIVQFSLDKSLNSNLYCLWQGLYFSVVTFTTLGYGDITPYSNASKLIAITESFIGSFILAIFVVIFVKKVVR